MNSPEPSRPDVGVVVVAAGRGLRAGAGLAKQFRPIGGVPMLLRSLRPFLMHPAVHTVVAVVPAEVNTEHVQERVYRGYERTMEELNETLQIFIQQKDKIYGIINNFEPLSARNKKGMTGYLDEFYKIINNPKDVKYSFIDKARID